jgi:hypothetical protein
MLIIGEKVNGTRKEVGAAVALVDPSHTALMQELLAAQMVLGRDPYCRRYTTAYRQGAYGFPVKTSAAGSGLDTAR